MEHREFLHVTSTDALNFFYTNLKDQTEQVKVPNDETIYVASVLASFAQTSVCETFSLPSPRNLSEVFDTFIMRTEKLEDSELLELAGAQTLFLNGFFREQMRKRHNVNWYDLRGSHFYNEASRFSVSRRRREILTQMAEHFGIWTQITSDLHKYLRENHYLLRLQ
jgi:hypothetical protein